METFDYNQKKKELIPCNLCGSMKHKTLAKRSVNGLDACTVICTVCSLVFINPRMSNGDYDSYYMSFYRQDRAAIKNKQYINDLEKNFENARKFGKGIVSSMGKYVRKGLTVDVGSSTGGILYGMM